MVIIVQKRTESKHLVLTEEKLVLGLNIPLEITLDALWRGLVFKIPSFKFALFSKRNA
jgi:hypothetical protein